MKYRIVEDSHGGRTYYRPEWFLGIGKIGVWLDFGDDWTICKYDMLREAENFILRRQGKLPPLRQERVVKEL